MGSCTPALAVSAWLPARKLPSGGGWPCLLAAAAAALLLLLSPARNCLAWDAERMRLAAVALGPRAETAARELQTLLPAWAAASAMARLDAINQHFNRRVAFADDDLVWSQNDYWASPLESLARGEGDCEDFAIAKYFALVAAGVPLTRLRLVYVRALLPAGGGQALRSQPHMVLAYFDESQGDPLVLDNLVPDIRPASQRSDLTPVFSFNTEGLWQGAGSQAAGDPIARLSRWREVVRKARAEGFL
jgi:predicted transglutaminase-like cysteine proteinase